MTSLSPFASWRSWWRRGARSSEHQSHLVARIRESAACYAQAPDLAIAERTSDLRRRRHDQASIDSPEFISPLFGLVVEAARRVLGIELYDVQLLAGLALSRGMIAEMQTGEGKTFAALLPACLHALSGKGVHVMTANPYLAQRDCELLAPAYRLLGLSVGLVEEGMTPEAKRNAYSCDITYGPGYQFGFDYLRDQLSKMSHTRRRLGQAYRALLRGAAYGDIPTMQRGHAVAIVNEADSVMLDEAATPLILSAAGAQPSSNAEVYREADRIAARLEMDRDFAMDAGESRLWLTEHGLDQLKSSPDGAPREGLDRAWPRYVEQALRAHYLYRLDEHYVIDNGRILLVDQHTGRIFVDRSWRDGLHQAVQAKERVTVTVENQPVARVTRQRFLRRYDRLCGMTGTAVGAEREFREVYGRRVVVIPPHRPCQRNLRPMRVFANRESKEQAIVSSIKHLHAYRQPILLGTASIETSERFAQRLAEQHLPHQLLNGKQDAEEAAIVSRAGEWGAITIATNMAGRGTDIRLASGVAELGGLHVIASEPQGSMRVDRQLLGRAARQGDPGSAQVFASADDRLIMQYAPALSLRLQKLADNDGEIHKDCARSIARVQRKAARQQAQLRRDMHAHDDWLERVVNQLDGRD